MVEVISPIEHPIVLREHAAPITLGGRRPGIAREPELGLHGGAEEGRPHGPDLLQEPRANAMVHHLESAPLPAGAADRRDGVAAGGAEVDDGNAAAIRRGIATAAEVRAEIRRLDVSGREVGDAGLHEGLDALGFGRGFHGRTERVTAAFERRSE